MNKRLLLIILGIITTLIFSSCQPLEVSAYCVTSYRQLCDEYPDYPESYIGFCISAIQSGKFRQCDELCQCESFRLSIQSGYFGAGEVIETPEECIAYFENLD